MTLDLQTVQSVTLGAVAVKQEELGFRFLRFSEEQLELYEKRGFKGKSYCTSGIQLRFRTDSEHLSFEGTIHEKTTRSYFAFDVLVNGERIGTVDNFSDVTLPQNYASIELPFGAFAKSFALGKGTKEVKLLFPWSLAPVLSKIELDDGAVIEPVKPSKKLLCFGDSITQGYDALYPSNKYTTRLAEALDAEEFNRAIGGDRFFPELALTREPFTPDYITVAYGTNDWSGCTEDVLTANCRAFYRNLSQTYPTVPIYAISPIWRKGSDVANQCGPFEVVEKIIREAAAPYENIIPVSGIDFLPHDENLYADLRLHPNDEGFASYADSLYRVIKNV